MPNHRKQRANSVPKGTAPEDFWPQIKILRLKKMQKQTPGKYSAVLSVVFFHCSPCSRGGVAVGALNSNRLLRHGALSCCLTSDACKENQTQVQRAWTQGGHRHSGQAV